MSAPLPQGSQRGVSTPAPARSGPPKTIAEAALDKKFCSSDQIVWAMAEHQRQGGAEDFSTFLVRMNILTAEQIRECERWLRAPKQIAGFELIEKVGQGGMGSVFRARQLSMDRDVALKILPPSLAQDPNFKNRFLHEARLSAKFNHLNIISGIDCGEDKGLTFFAMEFVDGRTLKQILKEQGKLDPDVAADMVQQIAGALVYAEAHGLVHRDIKPDNIMLTSANVAKLCDLGLAKLTTAHGDSFQTQAGMAVGTPHYISPEQARGDAHVDTRSDIYSLGATFYHLLTGKTPFSAPTSASVMALHLTETAPNPCDIDHAIPTFYGQILARMMAKEPADRYSTAKELLADLERARERKAPEAAAFSGKSSCALPARVSKGTATTGPRAPITLERREAPRFRKGTIFSWAVTILVCGGGAFAVWKYYINPSEMQVTQAPPQPARTIQEKSPEPAPSTTLISPDKIESAVIAAQVPPVVSPATSVAPQPAPGPNGPAKNVPPKSPREEPKKTTAVSVTPPESRRPAISATLVRGHPREPEPGKAALTQEVVYARALKAIGAFSAKDLTKLKADVSDLVYKPEYKLARSLLEQDVKDIEAAIQFEQNALKAIASAGGMVELNEETAKRFGAKQGKIKGFDPARGLMIDVSGAVITQNASVLPMKDLIKASPDGTALSGVRYRCIKGDLEGARALLNALQDQSRERWEQRLELSEEKAEYELMAAEEFKVLKQEAEAKHWQNLLKLLPEFQKAFGATGAWTANEAQVQAWKAEALKTLAPPEGIETSGTWSVLTLPGFNKANVKPLTEPAFNTRFVRASSDVEEGFERTGVVRAGAEGLSLAAAAELHFHLRNMGKDAVRVAVVFAADEKIYESPSIELAPATNNRVTLWLKCSEFKQVLSPDHAYNKTLPSEFQPSRLIFVVYSKTPFIVDLDGIVLK